MCPVSCNACQRTGMAKWIEAPEDCKWSTIDGKPSAGFSVRADAEPTYVRCSADADRLQQVNEVCCGTENPDAVCPRGAPPRDCPALCAVTFHALASDCGRTLQSLMDRDSVARFTAFDELVRFSATLSAGSAFAQCCLVLRSARRLKALTRCTSSTPLRRPHVSSFAPDCLGLLSLTLSLNRRLQPGELRRVPGRGELHRLVHARHCCGAGTAVRVGRGRLLHIAARCVGVRRERWSHFGTVRTIHNIQWYGLCSFGFY